MLTSFMLIRLKNTNDKKDLISWEKGTLTKWECLIAYYITDFAKSGQTLSIL